ncbi:MAG TPA: M56 family metallopeptidase [Chitinophagaceae bacterium]|nr:M56 family metallopeptidase [Chitinophagaceae bacterium]
MEALLLYIVKANIVFLFLYGVYWLLLRKEKFFTLNRYILCGCIALSFLVPLFPSTGLLPGFHSKISLVPVNVIAAPSAAKAVPVTPANAITSSGGNVTARFSFSFLQLAAVLYIVVVFIMLLRLAAKLLTIRRLLLASEKQYDDGIYYVNHNNDLPPFSFFKYAVVNMQQYSPEENSQVLLHEKVHIKQWHTMDVLLAEAACIVLWINPLIYKLRSSVKLNLEYIADENVLRNGVDRKNYQLNILNSCLTAGGYALTNLFTSSKIKLRIKMMNQKQSPLRNLLKYAFVLPVALAAYFVTSPVIAQKTGSLAVKDLQGNKAFDKVYIVLTENTDKEMLKTIESTMAELGLEFKTSDVQFLNGSLAAINIQVSQPGIFSGSVSSIRGNNGLTKPVIFYYEPDNGFHITNGEIPKEISGYGRKIVSHNLNGILIVHNGSTDLHGSCRWD